MRTLFSVSLRGAARRRVPPKLRRSEGGSNPGVVHEGRDCHARLGLARNDRFSRILLIFSFALVFVALPFSAFALTCPAGQHPAGPPEHCVVDTTSPGSTTELQNPLGDGATTIPVILGRVMRAGFGVLGAVALFMFVYGGFRWLTSGGNADSIKAGRDTMVWAILGIAVIFASYAIVGFIISAIAK